MTTINSEYIFPTPYWWIDIPDLDNDKMLEACYELERNQEGRVLSTEEVINQMTYLMIILHLLIY